MESNSRYTPSGLAVALGKKNKQTYYDLVKREHIHTKDLIGVAEYFDVPITVFFDRRYLGDERYIEERISDLEERVKVLESKHK